MAARLFDKPKPPGDNSYQQAMYLRQIRSLSINDRATVTFESVTGILRSLDLVGELFWVEIPKQPWENEWQIHAIKSMEKMKLDFHDPGLDAVYIVMTTPRQNEAYYYNHYILIVDFNEDLNDFLVLDPVKSAPRYFSELELINLKLGWADAQLLRVVRPKVP
ncbi:MAG: hypothetical protein AABZ55_10030 [Bdellovibrionota bacterium]